MRPLAIAVTGLHRGENPQPGAGIIRSLRRALPNAHFIGLVYDIQESGIYAVAGPDQVHLMPYPSAGKSAYLQRLDALRRRTPIDILIPSLDAELELLVHSQDELAAREIRVCLPDAATLRRRSKALLPELAAACGIAVPKTRVAHDFGAARAAAAELGFPLMIKGVYYDAQRAQNLLQAQQAVTRLLAEWGAPVILQRCVNGPEFNVLGLGDGSGGIIEICSIRKTALSEMGKGLGGIVVDDPRLRDVAARLIGELRWPGPFEIELIYDEAAREFVLIEMNPRFPAWVDFPSMIGANFPVALVRHIQGEPTTGLLSPCAPGQFFLRHQVEVVGDIARYAALLESESGPIFRHPSSLPSHEIANLSPAAAPASRVAAR